MFDPKTQCVVVVGAQWGDEGKGKLVDVLSERADCVVRYQGGANAGHTVVIGERAVHPAADPLRHPARADDLRHRQRRGARPRDALQGARRPDGAGRGHRGPALRVGAGAPGAAVPQAARRGQREVARRSAPPAAASGPPTRTSTAAAACGSSTCATATRSASCWRSGSTAPTALLAMMGAATAPSLDEHLALLRTAGAAPAAAGHRHRAPGAPRAARRQAGAPRGGAGRAPRRGPRHLPLRDQLQHHRGRRVGRRRASGRPPSTACSAS